MLPGVSHKKPILAKIAGILWCVWAVFDFVSAGFAIRDFGRGALNYIEMSGDKDHEVGEMLDNLSAIRLAVNLVGGCIFLVAGVRSLSGATRSVSTYGWVTLVLVVAYLGCTLYAASVVIEIGSRSSIVMGGAAVHAAFYGETTLVYYYWLRWGLLVTSGVTLTAVLALTSNRGYTRWWQSKPGNTF